jgi:signal transduction histidine kinase
MFGRIGRKIKKLSEYEKQRRFIADAGHEIKTPLAIIYADADVLEMEVGKNEWLEDIRKQAKRLTGLMDDLIYMFSMEESDKKMQMMEFSFSDAVQDTLSSFQALEKIQNKNLQYIISSQISMSGNEKAIRKLVNILMENAFKYSPENGLIMVEVQKNVKYVHLTVFNITQAPISKEDREKMFERFCRLEAAYGTATEGYGIGLSIAKAIVQAHNGKIYADAVGCNSLKIVVSLPLKNTC